MSANAQVDPTKVINKLLEKLAAKDYYITQLEVAVEDLAAQINEREAACEGCPQKD